MSKTLKLIQDWIVNEQESITIKRSEINDAVEIVIDTFYKLYSSEELLVKKKKI